MVKPVLFDLIFLRFFFDFSSFLVRFCLLGHPLLYLGRWFSNSVKQNVPGRRWPGTLNSMGGFNFGSLAVLLQRARNLRSMALRPHLSAGLLVSVSMLGRFD
jgi:hypothetical protein